MSDKKASFGEWLRGAKMATDFGPKNDEYELMRRALPKQDAQRLGHLASTIRTPTGEMLHPHAAFQLAHQSANFSGVPLSTFLEQQTAGAPVGAGHALSETLTGANTPKPQVPTSAHGWEAELGKTPVPMSKAHMPTPGHIPASGHEWESLLGHAPARPPAVKQMAQAAAKAAPAAGGGLLSRLGSTVRGALQKAAADGSAMNDEYTWRVNPAREKEIKQRYGLSEDVKQVVNNEHTQALRELFNKGVSTKAESRRYLSEHFDKVRDGTFVARAQTIKEKMGPLTSARFEE